MSAEIVVHDLLQAREVLFMAKARGVQVRLRSARDAAAYYGVGYLHALGESLNHDLLVDCHDDAGLVMAGLRTGCRSLIFSGCETVYQKLKDMSEQLDASIRLEGRDPCGLLVLSPGDGRDEIEVVLESLAS